MTHKLGKIQQEVLDELRRRGSWTNRGRASAWKRDTPAYTERVLTTLVHLGEVACDDKGVYRPA